MEVKVNVLNEMKKLRHSTYADRLTWVDELVQNAQRAKATHIKVTVEYDRVIIEDNGVGCSDPQVLFDKSSSGWDESVASQNPFGEGFFSTMMVADTIKVSSIGFDAVFDVKEMFEKETTDCIKVRRSTRRSGFVVVLSDMTNEYSQWATISRFREVGKYIKSPTMSINGERVKFAGTEPDTENIFAKKVSNEWFTGWIQPFKWGADGYDDSLRTFAYSRFVKNQPMWGVRGVLNFVDGKISLRSPDRKDVIYDSDYDRMTESLKEEVKKMFISVLRRGSDEDIAKYADTVERYLSIGDYRGLVKFKFLSDSKDEEEREHKTHKSTPSSGEGVRKVSGVKIGSVADFSSESAITHIPVSVKESKQTGIGVKELKYGFYVKTSEVPTMMDAIQLAQLYNIPVVEIRNVLEEKVLMEDRRFRHISELPKLVTMRVDFKNITPQNEAEIRAYKILAEIGRSVAGRYDMFSIADVRSYRVINIDGDEVSKEEFESFAVAKGNSIFINRKYLAEYKGLKDDASDLTAEDMKFVLMNIDTIAHEMAHVIYGTLDNTKEHFEAIGKLVQRIIFALYGGR